MATAQDRCRVRMARHPEFTCDRPATLYVHRQGRAASGRYTCTAHAGRVIRELGQPDDTVSVVVL